MTTNHSRSLCKVDTDEVNRTFAQFVWFSSRYLFEFQSAQGISYSMTVLGKLVLVCNQWNMDSYLGYHLSGDITLLYRQNEIKYLCVELTASVIHQRAFNLFQ